MNKLSYCLWVFALVSLLTLTPSGRTTAAGDRDESRKGKSPAVAKHDPAEEIEGENEGEDIIGREKFIHDRRAGGPGKMIPSGAYEQSVREKMQLIEKNRLARGSARTIESSLPAWQSASQGGLYLNNIVYVGGRSNDIVVDPNNSSVQYLATAGGGVWKTTDNGSTWNPLTDGLTTMAGGALAMDPQHPDTLFWATGEHNYSGDSYYGDGIFRTTDGGTHWTRLAPASVSTYTSDIVIDPTNPLIRREFWCPEVHKRWNYMEECSE